LSGAHGAGVSLVAGVGAITHPTQGREENGAAAPGLTAGVSVTHLDEVRAERKV